MRKPLLPESEAQRLDKLESLGLIYSPAEKRFDRITKIAQKVFDVPTALISLVNDRCQWFKSVRGLDIAETPREISFCGHAILQDSAFIVQDTLLDPDFLDNPLVTESPHIRFYAGQPINYQGVKLGTLCIIDTKPRELSPADLEQLQSLAAWIENELEVSVLGESQTKLIAELSEAKRQAMIDPLTGLWNRRGLEKLLPVELSRAGELESPVSLLILDVDEFKSINDNYGHAAGDRLLKEIASRLRETLRPHDLFCRYGGDEFLLFLSECNNEGAKATAKRILDKIQSDPPIHANMPMNISLSAGSATSSRIYEGVDEALFELADSALLEAKADGGNECVHRVLAPPSSCAA